MTLQRFLRGHNPLPSLVLGVMLGLVTLSSGCTTPSWVVEAERIAKVALPIVEGLASIVGVSAGEALAQGRETSSSLASLPNSNSVGSNHNTRASFAWATASSSMSPAEPQPGSSGNTADQRFVSRSNSTTNRSFMRHTIALSPTKGKPTEGRWCATVR
jgi:hypothetical protein